LSTASGWDGDRAQRRRQIERDAKMQRGGALFKQPDEDPPKKKGIVAGFDREWGGGGKTL